MRRKLRSIISVGIVGAMLLLIPTGCGGNSQEAGDGKYSAKEVTSELSCADAVQAFCDSVDTEYAYDLAYELAYAEKNPEINGHLGWRMAGSREEHACADFLLKEMEKIGLENVTKLPSKCDSFQFDESSLTVEGTDIELVPASYQVNGTDGNLTREIVDCGTGFIYDYEGLDVKDKIALVKVDQANESWIDGYMRMADQMGAAALVTWADSGYGESGPDTVNVQDVCCEDLLPTAAISANDAKVIKDAIGEGKNMCTLNIDAVMKDNEGTTYNVVGMIPGKNHSQRIIVSAHYDKYWWGFQDDCTAIGLVFAVAKGLIDSGYTPENDIYFVCHGAEEWGVTDSQFDWTTGAWGMVNDHSEFADSTIAMLNCELPAIKLDKNLGIAGVPEFYSMIEDIFQEGLVVTAGDVAFDTKPMEVTTMEDGITYRCYGVPYLLNMFDGTDFICQSYHTMNDNKDTYHEDTFRTNINWYGAYVAYIDTMPALPLDLTQSAKDLKKGYNEDYAKEAGIDTESYNAQLKSFKAEAKKLKEEIDQCNSNYEEAVASGDEKAAAKEREKGIALNKKSLEAFQMVQDAFFKNNDFGVGYGHPFTNNNIELIDGVLAGLEEGVLWAEDEESGAGDKAWQINSYHDYNYMLFGKEIADYVNHEYTDEYYKDGKDQAQWGWKKQTPVAETSDYAYELLNAESLDDIDVKKIAKGYKSVRAQCIEDVGKLCKQEIKDMKKIADYLGK